MMWTYIISLFFVLANTLAYNEYYYPNIYGHGTTQSRVDDVAARSSEVYQERANDRVPSERSIPYRTDVQRVHQGGRVRPSEELHLRNGNLTKATNSFKNTFPSLNSRRGTREPDSDSVVFPGLTSRSSSFVPEIPEECEEFGICEHVPNYPHDYVDDLITQMGDTRYRFNLDVETPEIAQRGGAEENNQELCKYNETIIYPSAAKNLQNKWVLIVNKKNEKVQGFKIEKCIKADKPCDSKIFFPMNFKAECQQKRAERSMWSINEAGNMVVETVALPTCCTCVLKIKTAEYDDSK